MKPAAGMVRISWNFSRDALSRLHAAAATTDDLSQPPVGHSRVLLAPHLAHLKVRRSCPGCAGLMSSSHMSNSHASHCGRSTTGGDFGLIRYSDN